MKPENQRLSIAEACGWKVCYDEPWLGFTDHNPSRRPLPDYLHDLNAMYEAEKILEPSSIPDRDSYWEMYVTELSKDAILSAVHTDAASRAEAFLKTIGRWEE